MSDNYNIPPVPESAIVDASTRWGIGGGTLGYIYGYVSSTEGAVFIGVIATILGLLISLYYQRKREKRESKLAIEESKRQQEIHEAQLEFYKSRGNICNEN